MQEYMKHFYRYISSVRNSPHNTTLSNPGYRYRLRRDDGKSVLVGTKRLQKIEDAGRLTYARDEQRNQYKRLPTFREAMGFGN